MFPAHEMTGRRNRRWRRVSRFSLERDLALRIVSLALFAWLVIGACAAVQRGYITHPTANCGSSGTIAVTIIAGPMNYLGVNPRVRDCQSSIFKPIKFNGTP